MTRRIRGFDKVQRDLKKLQKNAQELHGTQEVQLGELLTDKFMQTNSQFNSIDEFFEALPWSIESQEDLEAIPDEEIDRFVDENSNVGSWSELLDKAGMEFVTRKLGI